MKTFYEEFKNFRVNFTLEKLFLENTFSKETQKKNKIILIPLILFTVGFILLVFKFFLFGAILFIVNLVILIAFMRNNIKSAEKELKSKGLPVSNKVWTWKTEELEDMRIKKIIQEYKNTPPKIIHQWIIIAEEQMKNIDRGILDDLEKILEFFAKNFFAVVIGILIGLFNKSEYTNENFIRILKMIFAVFLTFLTISLYWKFYLRSNFTSYNDKKEKQYKDFIYSMKNVLLKE